jgi:hypothetical protein
VVTTIMHAHTPHHDQPMAALHRGFVMRDFEAYVTRHDGSRFSFGLQALNKREADQMALDLIHEPFRRLVVHPVPADSRWHVTLAPDDAEADIAQEGHQRYRQALAAEWAKRTSTTAAASRATSTPPADASLQPGSALNDMAEVLKCGRSAANDADLPPHWPDMPLPHLRLRDRVVLAWAFVLAIVALLMWSGVI